MPNEKTDPVIAELQMIRKLLVLGLLRTGITQSQLGGVLGLSQSQVSEMFPKGALAAFKGKPKKVPRKEGAELEAFSA
jgi:predicted XRE-type DNA-binding protein